MRHIRYTSVKYQLKNSYKQTLPEWFPSPPEPLVQHELISLEGHNFLPSVLRLAKRFAWDGPSGPVRDRKWTMRPSAVHDAFYRLIRHGLLGPEFQKPVDRLYREMLVEDGLYIASKLGPIRRRIRGPQYRARAWIQWRALRRFGASSVTPESILEVETAP